MTRNSRPFSSRFVSSLGLQNSRISKNAYKLKIKESKIGVLGQAGGISGILCKVLDRCIRWYYHCDIPYSLSLKNVYFCREFFGVVINPNAFIGEGTYIQHGVTIGSRDDRNNIKAPNIGKNCYIGAKATIIGDIRVGNNVKIGAGAAVISDIPDGATAVGVPTKIILK